LGGHAVRAPLQRPDVLRVGLPACAGRGHPRWPALLELRFASESCRNVEVARSLGYALPLRPQPRGPDPAVFPRRSRRRLCGRQSSSLAIPLSFRASSRSPCRQSRARERARRPPLLGFLALQRLQREESTTCRGSRPPATFRLQGFAPSCRFSPPRAFRVCFPPVALLGLTLQGFPLSRSRTASSAAVALLAFAAADGLPICLAWIGSVGAASPILADRMARALAASRALLPSRVRSRRLRDRAKPAADPLLGLCLPRVFPRVRVATFRSLGSRVLPRAALPWFPTAQPHAGTPELVPPASYRPPLGGRLPF